MATKEELENAFHKEINCFAHLCEGLPLSETVRKTGDRIVDLVYSRNFVSLIEVQELFERVGFDWRGTLAICWSGNEHVIFWYGWNEDACNAIGYAFKSGKIMWEPCTTLMSGLPGVYVIDGGCLDLPVITGKSMAKARNGTLKSDRWLPIVLVKKETWLKFADEHNMVGNR